MAETHPQAFRQRGVAFWGRTLALLALLSAPGAAQESGPQSGTLKGRILDDETGDPVPGAIVRIKGRQPLTASAQGTFQVSDLSPGQVDIAIQAIGFEAVILKFPIAAGQVIDRIFPLQFTGTKLPDLEVKVRAQRLAPRYSEFERRRGLGLGTYFRWEEMKAFHNLGDVLRTVRGVRIRCDQAKYECFAIMSRTPGCLPTWWIDGVEVRSFHENTSIRDIYGVEIYRGPGEVPGDFGGSNAACGVIVLWTKSRPYR